MKAVKEFLTILICMPLYAAAWLIVLWAAAVMEIYWTIKDAIEGSKHGGKKT